MNSAGNSARNAPIVSGDRVKDEMQSILHLAVHVERRFTVKQIEELSGVPAETISTYISSRIDAQRQPSLGHALSIAVVLGKREVNRILALIGYGGAAPLEEADTHDPFDSAVNAMQALGEFCHYASDHRIDHTEAERAAHAADVIIAEMIPFSHSGHAA